MDKITVDISIENHGHIVRYHRTDTEVSGFWSVSLGSMLGSMIEAVWEHIGDIEGVRFIEGILECNAEIWNDGEYDRLQPIVAELIEKERARQKERSVEP